MPRKDFNDDISALSEEGGGFFGAARRARGGGKKPVGASPQPSVKSSSASVASGASSGRRSYRRGRSLFGGFKKWSGPDDVSVSDSLCSGVLRGDAGAWGAASSHGPRGGGGGGALLARAASTSAVPAPPPSPVAGGVADFSLADYEKRSSGISLASSAGAGAAPDADAPREEGEGDEADEAARREQRKERVREKLDRYKRDQRQLKQSCGALEAQLAATTAKLKEVDANSSFKIDALEGELQDTRGGMERMAEASTREATDQSDCIKSLGKKLIRQAHVIKRQKDAVGQYRAQLEAMQKEMALQDVQDAKRAEEYFQLKDQCEAVTEQKVHMQRLLQENIEEMMDLKAETERDAKLIMEQEFHLQQKEATLDRLAREVSEKAVRIATLDQELQEMTMEVEVVTERLQASEDALEETRRELARADAELEERRRAHAARGGEGGDAAAARAASAEADDAEAAAHAEALEDFEAALQAKDATIRSLDETVREHEATVQELNSKIVKMSSTYKQESYLKRKEIAKLKQTNAEYALKLRALEKAFKCVNAPSETSDMIDATMHGVGGKPARRDSAGSANASSHGKSLSGLPGLRQASATREDKAAAVQQRLGRAPYRFPSMRRKESQIVVESNFFDDASDGPPSVDGPPSADGRKGELPEEC